MDETGAPYAYALDNPVVDVDADGDGWFTRLCATAGCVAAIGGGSVPPDASVQAQEIAHMIGDLAEIDADLLNPERTDDESTEGLNGQVEIQDVINLEAELEALKLALEAEALRQTVEELHRMIEAEIAARHAAEDEEVVTELEDELAGQNTNGADLALNGPTTPRLSMVTSVFGSSAISFGTPLSAITTRSLPVDLPGRCPPTESEAA